jgi:hypothetical protein
MTESTRLSAKPASTLCGFLSTSVPMHAAEQNVWNQIHQCRATACGYMLNRVDAMTTMTLQRSTTVR